MSPMVLLNATQLRPSEKWLASSLMFADRVSAINAHGKGFYSPKLEERGMWEPADLGEFVTVARWSGSRQRLANCVWPPERGSVNGA